MAELKLYWDSVQNAVSYNLYWGLSPGITVNNGTLINGIKDIYYTHSNLLEETTYYYIVAAVDLKGNIGAPSNEFSAKTSKLLDISVSPGNNAEIILGSQQQFNSYLDYSSGTLTDITSTTSWDTDNHSVATIDNNGLLSSVALGSVNISANYQAYSKTIPATIELALDSIDISPLSPSIVYTQTQQFTATGHYSNSSTADITDQVIWTSALPSIATIDSYGLATGVSIGSTQIKATKGSVSASTVLTTKDVGPLQVAGLLNWIKADAGITLDGNSHITAWADQSSNGHNWTNPGAFGYTSTIISGYKNGLPVVHNTGSDYFTQPAFISGTAEAEVFIVVQALQASNNVLWQFGSQDEVYGWYPYLTGQLYETFGSNTYYGPFTIANNGNAMSNLGIYNVSAGSGANNYVIRLNGTTVGTGNGTPGWATTFNLFSDRGSVSFNVGEMIIYNHVLSSSDRTIVYDYLQQRWNTPNGV